MNKYAKKMYKIGAVLQWANLVEMDKKQHSMAVKTGFN